MKRLCLAVAAVWCFCLAATAQNQIQVTWSFTNYFGATAPVSRLTIRPLQPFQIVSNNYIVPNTLTFTPATYPSITNGSITTNVFTGSLYVATASGPGWAVTKTNYFPIQLTNGGPAYSASTYDVAGFATYNNVLTGIFFTGTNFITGGSGGTNYVSGPYITWTNGSATNLTIFSGIMSSGLITNLYVLNNSDVGGVLYVNNVYWSNSPVVAGSGISVSTTGGVATVSATGSGGGSGNGFPLTNNANGVFAITNLAGITVGGLASGASNVIGTNFIAMVSNNIVLFAVTNGTPYFSQPILASLSATNGSFVVSGISCSNIITTNSITILSNGVPVAGITNGNVYGNGSLLTGISGGSGSQTPLIQPVNAAAYPITNLSEIVVGGLASGSSNVIGTNFFAQVSNNIVLFAVTNGTPYFSQPILASLSATNGSFVVSGISCSNIITTNSITILSNGVPVAGITNGNVYGNGSLLTGISGGSGSQTPLIQPVNAAAYPITNLSEIVVGGLASGSSNVIGTNFFAQVSNNIVLFAVTNGVLYVSQPILAQIMATNYPLMAASGTSSNLFGASGQSNIVNGSTVLGIAGGNVYFPVNTSKTNFTLAAGLASGAEHIVPGPSNQWTVEWDAATNIYWYGGMTRMKDTNGVWINAFDSRGGLGVGTTNYQGAGNIYASNNITASNSITAVRGTITGNGIGITNIQNAYTATNLNNALVTTGNGLMVRDVDGSSMGITGGGITVVYNPASGVPPFALNNHTTDDTYAEIDPLGNIWGLSMDANTGDFTNSLTLNYLTSVGVLYNNASGIIGSTPFTGTNSVVLSGANTWVQNGSGSGGVTNGQNLLDPTNLFQQTFSNRNYTIVYGDTGSTNVTTNGTTIVTNIWLTNSVTLVLTTTGTNADGPLGQTNVQNGVTNFAFGPGYFYKNIGLTTNVFSGGSNVFETPFGTNWNDGTNLYVKGPGVTTSYGPTGISNAVSFYLPADIISSGGTFSGLNHITGNGSTGVSITGFGSYNGIQNSTVTASNSVFTNLTICGTNVILGTSATSWNGQFSTLNTGGYTNTSPSMLEVDVSGAATGNVVFWNKGGVGGTTPCANQLWTHALPWNFELGTNCGFQLTGTLSGVTTYVYQP